MSPAIKLDLRAAHQQLSPTASPKPEAPYVEPLPLYDFLPPTVLGRAWLSPVPGELGHTGSPQPGAGG